jgi:hypothetical protein
MAKNRIRWRLLQMMATEHIVVDRNIDLKIVSVTYIFETGKCFSLELLIP